MTVTVSPQLDLLLALLMLISHRRRRPLRVMDKAERGMKEGGRGRGCGWR